MKNKDYLHCDTWREVQLSIYPKSIQVRFGYLQFIAPLRMVSNCMPYKMRLCGNKKGKSIGSDPPLRFVFSIEYLEFFRI